MCVTIAQASALLATAVPRQDPRRVGLGWL